MMYSVMLEYPRDRLIILVGKYGNALDAAVKYVLEHNEYLENNWTGDSKKFFIQKDGTKEWSLDGVVWNVDNTLEVT